MSNYIPVNECQAVNLRDITDERSIVALHETGHLIVMYALGLINSFNGINIIYKDGDYGTTEMSPEFREVTQNYALNYGNLVANYNQSGDSLNAFIDAHYLQGPKLYLPNICRLFAGGSITRYYEIAADYLCKKDEEHIKTILTQYEMAEQINEIKTIVDSFMRKIFFYYETLIKGIYINLLENEELTIEDVNQIIHDWKEAYPFTT